MKIIPKYDQGGYLQYFAQYNAVQTPQVAPQRAAAEERPTKAAKQEKDEMISSKDIIDLMKGTKGLTNEMQVSMSQLVKSMKLSEMLGATTDDLLRTFAQFKVQAETMEHNKAVFDEAVKQTKQDGALSDPAISASGNLLYQKRDGSLGEVPVETYLSNKKSYKVISNDQFINLRQYTLAMAFDQNYTNVLDNSMSIKKFDQLIDELKGTINSSEFKYNTLVDTEKVKEGLRTIQNLSRKEKQQLFTYLTAQNVSTKDGVYNISISDKTNKEAVLSAIKYISQYMPENAKAWAAYKTGSKDKNEATMKMVTMALSGMSSQETNYSVDYEGTKEGFQSTKGGKSKGSSGEPKATWLTNVQNGYGGEEGQKVYNEGSSATFTARGTYYGGFLDTDGKPLTNITANDLMNETGIAGISNIQSVYFGNQKMSTAQLQKLAIENNGMTFVILPCIKQNGSVKPDFSMVQAFQKIVDEVTEKNLNATPEQREKLITQKVAATPALRELLTASGRLDNNKFGAFLLTDGLISSQYFDVDNENKMVVETENENSIQYYKDVVKKAIYNNYKDSNGKVNMEDVENELNYDDYNALNPFDWFGNYSHLYKGTVYIPVTNNNPLSALLYSKQQPDSSIAKGKQSAYQRWNQSQKINHVNPTQGWQ